jgi:hypothetical protein
MGQSMGAQPAQTPDAPTTGSSGSENLSMSLENTLAVALTVTVIMDLGTIFFSLMTLLILLLGLTAFKQFKLFFPLSRKGFFNAELHCRIDL